MEDHQIQKYDRLYGGMRDVCLRSKPSTVKDVDLLGRAETFIVESMRHAEKGDFVFIEAIDSGGVTRIALPPRVTALIASQRDSLTARRRSIASRATARQSAASFRVAGYCWPPTFGSTTTAVP
jgi:hypothetical protein